MRRAALGSLIVLGACGDAPALAGWTSAVTGNSQGSGSTGVDEITTGSTTLSGSETSTSEAANDETLTPGSSSGEPTTEMGQPVLPPMLLTATLTPELVEVEGPIAVHALTEHADGVRMTIDGGDAVELDMVTPGEFVAEVGVFTALANGIHDVVLTAWKGAEEAPPLLLHYEAKLKPAGGEAYWDASGVLGAGFGRSIAVDQEHGWVFELGDTEDRCYVRRRGAQGEYLDTDLLEVLPDQPCTGTAIELAADGTLSVLAEVTLKGQKVWWLGRKNSWDAPMVTIAWGGPGEKAYALAQHPEAAEVAVCGTTPTGAVDITDGLVTIFRADAPGLKVSPLDYKPNDEASPHDFGEILRDCAYAGDVLVLAGEVVGQHPDEVVKINHDRLLLIEFDTVAEASLWTVATVGPGLAVQSGARAIAITDGGTYLTLGYACEDTCTPQLHLREFLPGGVPSGWNVLPAVAATFATDMAWSPAGYAVITAGKSKGPWWTEFWLQGWTPGEETPAWSYGHLDQPQLAIALGVAIAKYGRIYAVGVANGGVPALAIVDP